MTRLSALPLLLLAVPCHGELSQPRRHGPLRAERAFGRRRPVGPAWTTSASEPICPCANASLCQPITRVGGEKVYAFHITGDDWRQYDWAQITTVAVFGSTGDTAGTDVVDPELLCHAHAHGARVTLGTGGPPQAQWHNATAVDSWVSAAVGNAKATFTDGLNIDIEEDCTSKSDASALTALVRKASSAMHGLNPASHVSFDVPSGGLGISPTYEPHACGKMDMREYDFKALAEALDFLLVMDCKHAAVSSLCIVHCRFTVCRLALRCIVR